MSHGVALYIDTSDMNVAKVAIEIDGKRFEKISQSKILKSQMVLPLIEGLLSEHKLPLSLVESISVVTGPGSFTGLRVGIAIANALATLLEVPLNGHKTLVTPNY